MIPTLYQQELMSVPEDCCMMIGGGRGGGKALCGETAIPTPTGWSLLKDLVIGDKVFDEHGRQCSIVGIFDSLPEKAYRLHFSDGTHLDACDEHQWVTLTHAERKHYLRHDKSPAKGLPDDWAKADSRTTQDIVDTLKYGKRRDNNHCIPTTDALHTDSVDLPIDPYLLGIWLGDGTTCNGNITTMDPEVVESFTDSGFTMTEVLSHSGSKAKVYTVGPVSDAAGHPRNQRRSVWGRALAKAGIISDKHVPSVYMRASAEQRLALLQGLMDSDGHAASDKKRVEFSNNNKRLVDAVVELARSLGEKPVAKAGRATLYGKDCGEKWRVSWRAKVPCFRLQRKLARITGNCEQESRHLHRMIVAAEPIVPVPMRCLTVDSPNHMYLAGEGMIPTHNTIGLMFLILSHGNRYGDKAKVLLVRHSHEALRELTEEFHKFCNQAYPRGGFTRNKTEGVFVLPGGATVQFGQIDDQADYDKYQGKSYTMIIVEEYGLIVNPKWVWLLMSNLRGDPKVPKRFILACNPGGPQHGALHRDFILAAPPWKKYKRGSKTWINCSSTWRDNTENLDADYIDNLRDSCNVDEELFKAWDTGDWNISRGAYWAGCLDQRVHQLTEEQWPVQKLTSIWCPFIGGDWGSACPSVFYICGESPGGPQGPKGIYFPKGSLILCDEISTHDPRDQSFQTGLRWGPDKLAEAVLEKCEIWGCPPVGVCDDAYGLDDSLINTLCDLGIYVQKPKKERIAGWAVIRKMLDAVNKKNGQPGLYISERCENFWKTAPDIQRDPKRPEDILTTGADHALDAVRYSCMFLGRAGFSTALSGDY